MGKCISTRKKKEPSKTNQPLGIRFEDIGKHYNMQKVLGTGSYGIVRKASLLRDQSKFFAIKSLDKQELSSKKHLERVRLQIQILRTVDHPNIIRLYQIYEDWKYFHLVTQFCQGGQLFEHFVQKGKYTQKDTAKLMKSILRAVNYLHSLQISHRDLKPENFMFATDDPQSQLKLIDFGLSNKFESTENGLKRMQSVVGSPYYIAPEVLKGKYNERCDIWSIGVIMYMLLTGKAPFPGTTSQQILKKVKSQKLNYNQQALHNVSQEAIDLLQSLLNRDINQRLSANQALQHRWFNSQTGNTQIQIDNKIITSLRNFRATSKFQKQALAVIVASLDYSSIQQLKQAFIAFDTTLTGYLSFQELTAALASASHQIQSEQIKEIIENVDFKGDGRINYSEFIAATLSSKINLNEQILWKTFKHFDIDDSGFITHQNLKEACAKTGKKFSLSTIEEMIREVDIEQNQKVSFSEFKKMLGYSQMGVNFCSLCQEDIEKSPLLGSDHAVSDYSTTSSDSSIIDTVNYTQDLDLAYAEFMKILELEMETVITNSNIKVETVDLDSEYVVRSVWEVDVSMRSFLDFFNNCEKRLSWDKNIESIQIIQKSPFCSVQHTLFKKVLGISQRDLLTVCKEFQQNENIVSVSTSVSHPLCPQSQNVVRMHLFLGGYHLQDLGGRTRITSISKCSFGGNFPTQIIKKFTTQAMPKFAESCKVALSKEKLN